MAKKIILALIILILLSFLIIGYLSQHSSVNIYIDGENVSVKTYSLSPNEDLNDEICDFTVLFMNGTDCNINNLKNNISSICEKYGVENAEINIDSSIGKNQVPVSVKVSGTSMLPTLQDGQILLLNKTHDIQVGDIVVANSSEYGGIIKRVGDINGDSIYLISDNKNISYEVINGRLYEIKGITTWVDISDINGVIIN